MGPAQPSGPNTIAVLSKRRVETWGGRLGRLGTPGGIALVRGEHRSTVGLVLHQLHWHRRTAMGDLDVTIGVVRVSATDSLVGDVMLMLMRIVVVFIAVVVVL